jgi:tRNA U55 pseudouridine synthase TruB
MSDNTPIPVTTTQAQSGISRELRNNIYSALLSGDGIRNIESELDESLRASGFMDNLRAYITDLFRSGQATTCEEARELAMAKIREQTRGGGASTNGNSSSNGVTNGNSEDAASDINLQIPKSTIDTGAKTIMKELHKVCEITYEDSDNDNSKP